MKAPARYNSVANHPDSKNRMVSLFPHLKAEWNLSDKELGALAFIISIVVAVGSIPLALLADRLSRVKSIAVMAATWSLACISCMSRKFSAAVMESQVRGMQSTAGSGVAPDDAVVASDLEIHIVQPGDPSS